MDCCICNNEMGSEGYDVEERQINNGHVFRYIRCQKCGTLQLINKPENIADYYEKKYYANVFKPERHKMLSMVNILKIPDMIINSNFRIPFYIQYIFRRYFPTIMILYSTKINRSASILDVGGGNGSFAFKLCNEWGFADITVVDKYCSEGNFVNNKVKFIKSDLLEMGEATKYDLIVLNHSFEHMENPNLVLRKIKRIMKPSSLLLIRIPVVDCAAWEQYHEYWYQIDAPRHYFIYSEKAMRMICEKNGYYVESVVYDSKPSQFSISEKYRTSDGAFDEIIKTIKKDRIIDGIKTSRLNKSKQGDQAAFYLKLL